MSDSENAIWALLTNPDMSTPLSSRLRQRDFSESDMREEILRMAMQVLDLFPDDMSNFSTPTRNETQDDQAKWRDFIRKPSMLVGIDRQLLIILLVDIYTDFLDYNRGDKPA